MLKKNDRVRFKDKEKDSRYGVLIIFNIKGDIATCGSGDYASFGKNLCNAKLSELKKTE